MGPDVAVMDRFTFSFDAKELENMADENQGGATGAGSMTLEQVVAVITELAPQVAKLTAAMGPLLGAAEKVEHQASGEMEADAGYDKEATAAPEPAAAPAENQPNANAADKEAPAMDAALMERWHYKKPK